MSASNTSRNAEIAAAGAAMTYNVVLNRLLPEHLHVPANLAAAGALLAFARSRGASPADLGLARPHLGAGARTGLAVVVPLVASVAASSAPTATRDFWGDPRIVGLSPQRAAYELFVRIPIGTALAEELIFRGALLGLFRHNRSAVAAVAASSALFGAWHIAPTLASLRTNPAGQRVAGRPVHTVGTIAGVVAITGAAGAAMAWLRLRSGSVLAPVLVHAALNASAFGAARWLARRA